MKKNFLIIALPIILLVSCSKDKTISPVTPGSTGGNGVSKIKTWSNSASQRTYLYNNQGQLVEISSNTGSKVTYEYASSKITMKQYNTGGINDFTSVMDLDNNNLVITEKRPSNASFTGTFIYNDQKQMVKSIYIINGNPETTDYFYSNGNCDSARHSSNNNWQYTRYFTYYTDKTNYLSNVAYGYPFFGSDNKNLKKTDYFKYNSGTQTPLATTTYEFDAQGRAVKETTSTGNNVFVNFISYY
ncbi:MAG: hypothetical protein ACO25B_10115 [Chitinophagaceae bacterium]